MKSHTVSIRRCTLVLSLLIAITISVSSWAASAPSTPPSTGYVYIPGYGPGVAGHVTVTSPGPACPPSQDCSRPYADAIVEIENTSGQVLGSTTTNTLGAFLISMAPGQYFIHIKTVDFPFCPLEKVSVGQHYFTLAAVPCDSRIP